MLIKQRKVRRSARFTSRWGTSARRRREYLAALYSTAVILGVLFMFLLAAVYQTAALMRVKAPGVDWYIKYALPAFFLLVAAFVLWAFIRNVQNARILSRKPPDATGSTRGDAT